MKVSGIILSGGKSSRMGNEKGLIPLAGKPLISYAIHCLKPLCSEIIICANDSAYDQFGFKVIPDEYLGIGPISGIYSGLKESNNEINIVISCDMPLLTNELFLEMLQFKDFQSVVPKHAGFIEPLASIYKKSNISILEEMIKNKNYKLRELFNKINVSYYDVSISSDYQFLNVNTPSDILKAEKLMSKR